MYDLLYLNAKRLTWRGIFLQVLIAFEYTSYVIDEFMEFNWTINLSFFAKEINCELRNLLRGIWMIFQMD